MLQSSITGALLVIGQLCVGRDKMIPWQIKKCSNPHAKWTEYKYIQDGLRCKRVGRTYYEISRGKDWRSADNTQIAKLEFERGPTIDVSTGYVTGGTIPTRKALLELFRFAFQCIADSDTPPPQGTPIATLLPKAIKHFICRMRYYDREEEMFGKLFAGPAPAVSIADLVSMALDAHAKNRVRIPPKAMRFNPND